MLLSAYCCTQWVPPGTSKAPHPLGRAPRELQLNDPQGTLPLVEGRPAAGELELHLFCVTVCPWWACAIRGPHCSHLVQSSSAKGCLGSFLLKNSETPPSEFSSQRGQFKTQGRSKAQG